MEPALTRSVCIYAFCSGRSITNGGISGLIAAPQLLYTTTGTEISVHTVYLPLKVALNCQGNFLFLDTGEGDLGTNFCPRCRIIINRSLNTEKEKNVFTYDMPDTAHPLFISISLSAIA